MKSDAEIAREIPLKKISEIAEKLKLAEDDIELYGNFKAKIKNSVWEKIQKNEDGKLILVTSINPTAAGEGKTTTTIGLGDALDDLAYKSCIALREPSLGPCFGLKGGATGGGMSQVAPMDEINLHFTGDFHAITSAHNLLAAIIDNHIYQGNELNFDLNKITWRRVLDINDRTLRHITIAQGSEKNGVERQTGFDITVASELMAILCLSHNLQDMRNRIDKIIVGYDRSGKAIKCEQLNVTGALLALLKDAIKPNLVQTLSGTPVLIHGGPFANIAHGCNSIIATKHALKFADYVVTEAGFGADLGAEKFLDIKCPLLGKYPDAVVVVATIRALKLHGYGENPLEIGIENLQKHIEIIQCYNLPVVVALNAFQTDTNEEINFVQRVCEQLNVDFAISTAWADGARGGYKLAKKVIGVIKNSTEKKFVPLYDAHDSPFEKIQKIAREIYGADGVNFSEKAEQILQQISKDKIARYYPICIAKTQSSLSDDKNLLGRPKNFSITINDAKLMAGAHFVVAYAGNIMTMPGLPKHPAAEKIDLNDDGEIIGIF